MFQYEGKLVSIKFVILDGTFYSFIVKAQDVSYNEQYGQVYIILPKQGSN
jgi:hypothetical protein